MVVCAAQSYHALLQYESVTVVMTIGATFTAQGVAFAGSYVVSPRFFMNRYNGTNVTVSPPPVAIPAGGGSYIPTLHTVWFTVPIGEEVQDVRVMLDRTVAGEPR